MNEWNYIDQTSLDDEEIMKQVGGIPIDSYIDLKFSRMHPKIITCQFIEGQVDDHESIIYLLKTKFMGSTIRDSKWISLFQVEEDIFNCATGEREQLKPYNMEIPIRNIHSWKDWEYKDSYKIYN